MKLVLSDKEKKKHVVELGFVKGMITGVPSMTYLTSESVGCILRNAENINEMCHGTIIGDKAVVFHMKMSRSSNSSGAGKPVRKLSQSVSIEFVWILGYFFN